MKTKLLLSLALIFGALGLSQVKADAYTTTDLTADGWKEVTSLENTQLSQYVYVFYSVEGENLMLAQERVTGYQQNRLTGVYRTAGDPMENPQMVWMIDYSETFQYGLRNLSNPSLYMQSRGEGKDGNDNVGSWNIQFEWERSQSKWTRFNLDYSVNSWTIENTAANNIDDTAPYHDMYIGPWDEDASCFSDGKAVAGNKTGDYVGHFKLYRMEKSVYYGKKYYPEFTAVTSTDQLTDENMAANYYIVVAETNPDLAVTARNKEDANVRLKYVTQSVFTNAAQIWTLQANDGGYSFRNLKKDHALLQAYTEAWGTNIADEQTAVAHTKFELTSDDDTGFTILNSSFPGKYLGLWAPAHGYKSGENMAGNKTATNEIGHFFVYAISRSDYKTQFLANNTEVTDIFMTNPHVENTYGWKGTLKTFDKESFTGAPDNICLDLNNSGNTHQYVTLPAGDYLLKVATRGISNANAGIYVKVKSAAPGDDLVNVQVQKKNNTGNELGNGWGWTYLSFSIAEEKELEIGFYVLSGAYAGADDFHLYNNVVSMDETDGFSAVSDIAHANVTVGKSMTANVWNTFVIPFDMAIPSGWTVMEPTEFEDGTLTFGTASSIVAGKPYIVKPTEAVTSFSATDVTLKKDLDNTTVGTGTTVTMTGTYEKIAEIDYSTQDCYIIGIKDGVSSLYKVNSTVSIKPFRAYFTVSGATPGARIAINFDEDAPTGITLQEAQGESENAGMKDGKYLENGKIVIVKNGVKYATNGQIMK